MKWRRGKMSRDVIDRRGAPRVGGGAGMAIGGLGIPGLLILALVFFLNGGFSGGGTDIDSPFDDMQGGDTRGEAPLEGPDSDARLVQFTSFVLDDVQNFWEDTFSGSDASTGERSWCFSRPVRTRDAGGRPNRSVLTTAPPTRTSTSTSASSRICALTSAPRATSRRHMFSRTR